MLQLQRRAAATSKQRAERADLSVHERVIEIREPLLEAKGVAAV